MYLYFTSLEFKAKAIYFVGDLPHECEFDDVCNPNLACRINGNNVKKCLDPCKSAQCAENAYCETRDHIPTCICKEGFAGEPGNLRIGCKKVECVQNVGCAPNLYCNLNTFKCAGKKYITCS